ncbi:MAG: hypothetical protein PHE83_18980 [Opitutaceae bacterium]|jgi:hypothetical protein|nr:hypothetical protein [Opitutaceae bacterium]
MRNIATVGVGLLIAACILGFFVSPQSAPATPWTHESFSDAAQAARQAAVWAAPAQIVLLALGLGLIAAAWGISIAVGAVGFFVSGISFVLALAGAGLSALARAAVFRRVRPAQEVTEKGATRSSGGQTP